MPVYCITGANRGLGLEFVRQLSQSPDNTILATHRPGADPADIQSAASSNTHVLECALVEVDSIRAFASQAAQRLAGKKIDFLINNAGVNNTPAGESGLALNPENLAHQMAVNVIAPAKVVEFLLAENALADSVRVLCLTSGLGSMEISLNINPRKCVGYSISKAGLNMLAVHMSGDLRAKLPGAVVALVDPGWVKTRMGGAGAMLEPEESVSGVLKLLHGLKDEDNGGFFSYDGKKAPW